MGIQVTNSKNETKKVLYSEVSASVVIMCDNLSKP